MDLLDDDDEFETCIKNNLDVLKKAESYQRMEYCSSQDPNNLSQNNCEEKYLKVLREKFGHKSFRPLQWRIIQSIIEDRRDNCVIMTTGYGKSLIYQFPSVYTCGVTFVISPLISLMEDQVLGLNVQNISSILLGSAQKGNKTQIYEEIREGMYRIVYMTPEFATAELGLKLLSQMEDSLTLVAIDEAHCVSSWGHDFRKAFRFLSVIRRKIPKVPIIALTATATKPVVEDIINVLELKNPQKLCSGFDRPNLKFIVKYKTNMRIDLSKIIQSFQTGSVIIYCLRRTDTEEVAELLQSIGIACEAYHAGMKLSLRTEVHERFAKDQLQVIAATIAFGMGIDKPDVRMVINYGASKDIESYYQELGRAGRDGQPSTCYTFYSQEDFGFHAFMRSTTKSEIHRKHQYNLNMKMKEYLDITTCRRKYIMDYFNDPKASELVPHLNCCDNCEKKLGSTERKEEYEGIDENGESNFGSDAKILLNAATAMNKQHGFTQLYTMLLGSKNKKLMPQYQRHFLFGAGKHKPENYWKCLFKLLERKQFVSHSETRYPNSFAIRTVLQVTNEGNKWLNSSSDTLMLIPGKEMYQFFKIKRKELSFKPLYEFEEKGKIPATKVSQLEKPVKKVTLEEELLKQLIKFRQEMANSLDLMPYMIASQKCLQQLSAFRPKSIEEMELLPLDGFSTAKIKTFGPRFVDFIKKFMAETTLTADSPPKVEDEIPNTSKLCDFIEIPQNSNDQKEVPPLNKHKDFNEILPSSTKNQYKSSTSSKKNDNLQNPPSKEANSIANWSLLEDDEDDAEILRMEASLLKSFSSKTPEKSLKENLEPSCSKDHTLKESSFSSPDWDLSNDADNAEILRLEQEALKNLKESPKKRKIITKSSQTFEYDDESSDENINPSPTQRKTPTWMTKSSSQSSSQGSNPPKKQRTLKNVL